MAMTIVHDRRLTLLALPLALLGLAWVPPRAPLSTDVLDRTEIRVGSEDPSTEKSTLEAAVLRVRDELGAALVDPEQASLAEVQAALQLLYGADLTEELFPPEYVWVWDGKQWVRVCLGAALFQVDLPEGNVVVDAERRVRLR